MSKSTPSKNGFSDSPQSSELKGVLADCRELNNRSKKIMFSDLETAMRNSVEVEERLIATGSKAPYYRECREIIGEATRIRGTCLYYQARYREALDCFTKALDHFSVSHSIDGKGRTLNNFAIVFKYLGDYTRALDYYRQCLQCFIESNDVEAQANTRGNIGILYYTRGDLTQAILKIKEALSYFETHPDDATAMVWMANLGEACLAQGDIRAARSYLEKSLKSAIRHDDKSLQADVYNNLATLHIRQSEWKKAEIQCLEGIALAEEMSDPRMLVSLFLTRADIWQNLGYPEDQTQSEEYGNLIEKILIQARHINAPNLIVEGLRKQAEFYDKQGETGKAYASLKELYQLESVIRSDDQEEKWRKQRIAYELEDSEKQLADADEKISQMERTIQKSETEIRSLQEQLVSLKKKTTS